MRLSPTARTLCAHDAFEWPPNFCVDSLFKCVPAKKLSNGQAIFLTGRSRALGTRCPAAVRSVTDDLSGKSAVLNAVPRRSFWLKHAGPRHADSEIAPNNVCHSTMNHVYALISAQAKARRAAPGTP
jgi:hypothetical protein